ncbi:MAG: (2Fe-2S)-binding protein [Gammaproteobacteria bacterium]|nr:(2Fe-2S)-binding protein [Gammaproteobacteria bacterium]MDH4255321.1 (2Fe-2S)-binding protein [Gammaproteobacteria bacterium]MDH5310741.1 (2Fe-2S)-binding protein [Gammaproteobacteria bacterium]
MTVRFTLNNADVQLDVPGDTPLLYALRNDLGLNGPKFGCGLAQCGACTILVDGKAVQSCVLPLSGVDGRRVTTLEGLGTADKPHPLQRAVIELQAMQCGYCVSGIVMSAAALLADNPRPSDKEIRDALDRNLCRCGSHVRILRAVREAAAQATSGDPK